jgi:hypothetical protein
MGTGFSQKRCDNKKLEQDAASDFAHLALGVEHVCLDIRFI